MGIRVNKLIGYGLSDLQANTEKVTDDRIQDLSYLDNGLEECNGVSFDTYVENNTEDNGIKHHIKNCVKKGWKPYHSVTYDAEYGLPNVLLFQTALANEWSQYDNAIDYMEETENHKQKSRYRVFERGIFPYTVKYMNAITNEPLSNLSSHWWMLYNFSRDKKTTDEDIKWFNTEIHHTSQGLGFKDFDEAKGNVVPAIPEEIVLICKWLNIFKDTNTIYQLRPMLYVYWS